MDQRCGICFKILVNDDSFATLLGFQSENQYDKISKTVCRMNSTNHKQYNKMKEHILQLRENSTSLFYLIPRDVITNILFSYFPNIYSSEIIELQFWRHVLPTIMTSPRPQCCTAIVGVPYDLGDNTINACCENYYLAFQCMQNSVMKSFDRFGDITIMYLFGSLERIVETIADALSTYRDRKLQQIHETYIPIVATTPTRGTRSTGSSIVSKCISFFKNVFN